MPLPDPSSRYLITLPDGSHAENTVLLATVIKNPRFKVGAFTYAADPNPPEDWAARLAPYLGRYSEETLSIGKFCQIAREVRFLTSSANHATGGLSCFPFALFSHTDEPAGQPDKRDMVIGHDVWFGYGALILPGAQIGNGAIIGAGAVVRGTVPDYAIVTGNPGRIERYRFGPEDIKRLLALAWWNWSVQRIDAAMPAILAGDLDALEALAGNNG